MPSYRLLAGIVRYPLRSIAIGLALGCASSGADAPSSPLDASPPGGVALDGGGSDTAESDTIEPDTVASDSVEPDSVDAGAVDGPCRPHLGASALELDCALVRVSLTPFVVVDGTKDVGVCSREASSEGPLRCEVASGSLEVAATAPWSVTFVPSGGGTLTQIGFTGSAAVPGARAFLSNGFQSWSMSGAVALRAPLSTEALDEAFAQRGDPETLRSGDAFSWWWTVVGGGGPALVAGVTSASNWKSWVRPGSRAPRARGASPRRRDRRWTPVRGP